MENCNHCKSYNLVWDWANGDIVCASCGTINQEKFIDDRHYHRDFEDHEYTEMKNINPKIGNTVSAVNAVLYNGLIDDTHSIVDNVDNIINNNEDDKKLTTTKIVAGIYDTEQGLTAKELCSKMNVKSKKFWKSVKTDSINENRLYDIVKRNVYNNNKIISKDNWSVIKCAKKIIEKVQNSPELQNIKPDKLAITLLYISCQCVKINISKKDITKMYGVSQDTLYRHESIIQTILKKNS